MYNVEMSGRYFENGQPISSILSSYNAVTGILPLCTFLQTLVTAFSL